MALACSEEVMLEGGRSLFGLGSCHAADGLSIGGKKTEGDVGGGATYKIATYGITEASVWTGAAQGMCDTASKGTIVAEFFEPKEHKEKERG